MTLGVLPSNSGEVIQLETYKGGEIQQTKMVLGLDRLTLTASPPEGTNLIAVAKDIYSCAKNGDDMVPALGSRGRYRYAYRIKVPHLPGDIWPLFQFAPLSKGMSFYRIECNPNRLGADGIYGLKTWADTSTPHGWAWLLHKAVVSRFDVNIDVAGIALAEVGCTTKHSRRCQTWSRVGGLKEVRLETLYLGDKKTSDSFFRIYDLQDSKLPPGAAVATRFEHVDRATRPMLSALHKCSSPFLKLRVHLLNSLPLPGWDPVLWSIFLKLAQSAGLNCALKSLPAAYRKEASSILASSTSSQMEFQSCFSAWPKLIKDLGLQSGGPQGDFLGGSYSGIAA